MSRSIGGARPLLALAAHAAADVELTATADRDEVALDGTVTLEITAIYASKGNPGDLQLPPFRDFDVVSRSQSEQVSFAFVNGAPAFKRTIVTTLTLTPKRAGDTVIEPARLVSQGRAYTSRPIHIRVLPVGQAPPPRAGRPPARRGL